MTLVSNALRKSAGHPDAYCMWRPVVGYEGLYEVSHDGAVRSVARVINSSEGKVRKYPSKPIKPTVARNGYLRVCLCRAGHQVSASVHRLVALAFIPGVGDVVRHMDGIKISNSASNLAWGSHEQNHADKDRHGTKLFGEKHPNAKMTGKDVVEVRALHASGVSQLEICRRTGFGRGAVGFAVRRETWGHIE